MELLIPEYLIARTWLAQQREDILLFWAADLCSVQILEVNSSLDHSVAEIRRTRKTLMIY